MVRMCKTDYLQSFSPFIVTRYSLKGKKETPEQYILGGRFFINALLIFHLFHISRVYSSNSNKQSYDPCYFVIGYTVFISQAFCKGVTFQLPAKGIKSCSLCYMSNVG